MGKKISFFGIICILLSYVLVNYFLQFEGKTFHTYLINPLVYFLIFLLARKLFNKPFERKKERKEKIKTTIIFTFIYLIVFFLMGLILTFERTPYSSNIISIIKNIYAFIPVIILQELIRNLLVHNCPKKKIYYVIVTIVFTILQISMRNIWVNFITVYDTIKFIFTYGLVGLVIQGIYTQMALKYSKVCGMINRIIIQIVTLLVPVFPKMDWFFKGIYDAICYIILLFVTKYETEKLDRDINKSTLKKDNPLIYVVLLIILIVVVCFQIGVFRYQPIAVMSNSMFPTFQRGDAIIIEKIDEEMKKNLQKGDIIEYRLENKYVMHRIVEVAKIEGEIVYQTQGDNNNGPDSKLVTTDQIVGVIKFKVPYVGYPSVIITEFFEDQKPDVEMGN